MHTGPQSYYTARIKQEEPEWLYGRAKLRKEHFKPEDSVKEKDDLREEAAKSKGQDVKKDWNFPSGPKNDPKSSKMKMLGHARGAASLRRRTT